MKSKTVELISHEDILKIFLVVISIFISQNLLFGGCVYVNSENGSDANSGAIDAPFYSIHKAMEIVRAANNYFDTIKINPGIYALQTYVDVATKKDITNRRIVIEASYLPGHNGWTPERMPVIMSIGPKGEIPDANPSFVSCFLINSDKVTFRGLKFAGYPRCPNVRSFGIARVNNINTDLVVEQCMFVGEENSAHLQAGIIANGDEIKIDHCVFFKARNAVVYLNAAAGQTNTFDNSFTNNIVYGVDQAAIWTCSPGTNFVFRNNIVSNSQYVWMLLYNTNATAYTAENSVFVNNTYTEGINRQPGDFDLTLTDVIEDGDIELIVVDAVDNPLPNRFLHVKPESLGDNIGAGLFIKEPEPDLVSAINSSGYQNNSISVYPNPAEDNIYIATNNINEEVSNYQITNLMGNKVLEDTFVSNEIDVSALSAGVYIVNLNSKNGENTSETIIIH